MGGSPVSPRPCARHACIHSHKTIFVHIPKTAGTSIEAVLGMHGDKQDIGVVRTSTRNWITSICTGDRCKHDGRGHSHGAEQ